MDDHDHDDAERIDALTPQTTGIWRVTTEGSTHIWNLDEMTFMRTPGEVSRSGAFAHDWIVHRITRVDRWPRVGEVFQVWFDDPERPDEVEQWRRSSPVRSIERAPDTPIGPTLGRYTDDATLRAVKGVDRLLALAPEHDRSETSALGWLVSPTTYLEGRRPIDVIETEPDRVLHVAAQAWGIEW